MNASGARSISYDGYGRLLTYNRTGDPAQSNAYNGLDDRVSATSGSVTHEFVYDPDARLLARPLHPSRSHRAWRRE